MIDHERAAEIMSGKDTVRALQTGRAESWIEIDGAIVIYDGDDPPAWMPALEGREVDSGRVTVPGRGAVGRGRRSEMTVTL